MAALRCVQDVGEQTDLAASRPEKLKELVQHFA
jgi:hypothetical protein